MAIHMECKSEMGGSTRVWSCASLSEGVLHLADEAERLRAEEQDLLQVTKDPLYRLKIWTWS